MRISKQTVLRTTALFEEGERPEVTAGARTTLVVTRAVIEDVIDGQGVIHLYGYRKERGVPAYAGWQYAGNESKHVQYSLKGHAPAGVWPIVQKMEG